MKSSVLKDILKELKFVLAGKTLDTLIPPLVFVIIERFLGILNAVIIAIILSLLLLFYRIMFKKVWIYALSGFFVVLIASGFALLAGSAINYFIPGILSSALLFVLAFITVLIKKPLAALASHLTRGWELAWLFRDDVRPAYTEVTYVWGLYFLIRLVLQITLFIGEDAGILFVINTILGLPTLIVVLVFSYLYGMWRLRTLKGPGVDEFVEGILPPWRGQTKGF